jgi:hypothetical protein
VATSQAVIVEFAAWLQPHGRGVLDEKDPAIWYGAGDVDKLARNLLDALANDAKSAAFNGGAYGNDNQVVRLIGDKFTAYDGAPPGMWIKVSIDENQTWREAVLRLAAETARTHAALG